MSSHVENKDDKDERSVPETDASTLQDIGAPTVINNQTQSEPEPVAECSTSQGSSPGRSSDAQSRQRSHECCIVIPSSVISQSSGDKLMIIEAKDLVHSILKPKEISFSSPRHGTERVRSDDVAVNISNFLTYSRRNNCDMLQTSRGCCYPNSSYLDTTPRYVYSEQQSFPGAYSAATAYHPNEFIGLNNVHSRNSVLMSNLYPGPDDIRPPAVDFSAPPPYDTPFKLPTYEEVQREKELEGDAAHSNSNPLSARTLSFLTVDGEAAAAADSESKLLGTDFMFAVSFFLALIFNWIGFLLLLCFCHTVAARYGALSGFGLSLAKWTIIVKQTSTTPLQNAWLWWLITIFGLLICIRSLFQYIHIKRGWRLMSATMQERLLVYY